MPFSTSRRWRVALVPALAALPISASAQLTPLPPRPTPIDSMAWTPRGTVGIYFTVAEPKGEFARYVDDGWGFAGHGVLNVGRSGVIGLRLDGGWLNYGRETVSVADPFFGGRISYDITTSNNIAYLGVGPQLQLQTRYIRPYAYAVGGFSYLSTASTLKDIDGTDVARDNNFDDWTTQWAAGGGVAVPLWRNRSSDVALDIGGRYHFNGNVRYLREGGIATQPDGGVQLEVLESEVRLITWHVGLSIGMR